MKRVACRVLIAEDDADVAESLALYLEVNGYTAEVVHDGLDVLESARRYSPDVIVLDVGLPGLDGYQVAALLRKERRFDETLLVAITGWGGDEHKRAASDAGFNAHFTKPLQAEALLLLLAEKRRTGNDQRE